MKILPAVGWTSLKSRMGIPAVKPTQQAIQCKGAEYDNGIYDGVLGMYIAVQIL